MWIDIETSQAHLHCAAYTKGLVQYIADALHLMLAAMLLLLSQAATVC
jgi:hypothetical protein